MAEMSPEKAAIHQIVDNWLDSSARTDSGDHQLVIERVKFNRSQVGLTGNEVTGVTYVIRNTTNVGQVVLPLQKTIDTVVTPQ